METIQKHLEEVLDLRQEKKVKHKMGDIIMPVFMANLANANERAGIEISAKEHGLFFAAVSGIAKGGTVPRYNSACIGNGRA